MSDIEIAHLGEARTLLEVEWRDQDEHGLPCPYWPRVTVYKDGIELTQEIIDGLQQFLDKGPPSV